MRKYTSFVSVVAILAMVVSLVPVLPETARATADDTLVGWCSGDSVRLEWGSHWDSDVNVLLKAETYPHDDDDWYELSSSEWRQSYSDYDIEEGDKYWYRVRYHEYDDEHLSNIVSLRCDSDWYEDLELSPTSRTVDSGEQITFRAEGGDETYRWSTSDAYGSDQWGSSTYTVRFHNYSNSTQTRYVTVRSGDESERATVRVRPEHEWHDDLSLTPTYRTVDHGEYVTFYADGGDGHYHWESSVYGYGGEGSWYTVYFSNYSNRSEQHNVTVRSDNETRRATITVRPYHYPVPTWSPAPAPTWTPLPYPTWSPAPAPTSTPNPVVDSEHGLTVSQTARNVSAGQSGHLISVQAEGGDTVQFTLVVENKSSDTLYNARLTDILPAGLRYVDGSTTIDGNAISDGITSLGINLGEMVPNRVIAVRISAEVQPEYVPTIGSVVVYNTAQVRADDIDVAVSQLKITLSDSKYFLAEASGVETGTVGSVVIAALAGLMATLMYGLYTRSDAFSRRFALTQVSALQRDPQRLNFARLN